MNATNLSIYPHLHIGILVQRLVQEHATACMVAVMSAYMFSIWPMHV